jgi:hypothetical protein
MGFFDFDEVDPERCHQQFGGRMAKAERRIVLQYMAAATELRAYKGLAHSRIEGTWKFWTPAEAEYAAKIRQAKVDHEFPMVRSMYPSSPFFETSSVRPKPFVPMSAEDAKRVLENLTSSRSTEEMAKELLKQARDAARYPPDEFKMTLPKPGPDTERVPEVNGFYDPVSLGCCDMITPDGKWIFPQEWDTHYIAKHGLAPPREFIEDALAFVKGS